uniref:Uncharacterized protein n=1 Tax=Arundo donax TaxID=35708 RepID=A0A0A9HEE5_ARUDO
MEVEVVCPARRVGRLWRWMTPLARCRKQFVCFVSYWTPPDGASIMDAAASVVHDLNVLYLPKEGVREGGEQSAWEHKTKLSTRGARGGRSRRNEISREKLTEC